MLDPRPRDDDDDNQQVRQALGGAGAPPKADEHAFGADSHWPAAATAARLAGGNGGGVSSKFRVDGRFTRPGGRGREPLPPPMSGGGVPMCAAVLKDLRRRLKEAELEARAMRAERTAADKRDRLVSERSALCILCVRLSLRASERVVGASYE